MIDKNIDKKSIVILFSGAGSNLEAIINSLHNKDANVLAAITNNPEAKGIDVAKKLGITVELVDSKNYNNRAEFDKILVKKIKIYDPDLVVLAGFMRILTPIFTEQIRAINLHPSLLPRHKGLRAIEKSYKDGHDEGGVTIHWVSAELDGGEVVLQKQILKKTLSFEQYVEKIKRIEKESLLEAIRKVLTEK